MISIYVLVDPRDSRIYYVGQTQNPNLRWAWHISQALTQDRGRLTDTQARFIEIVSDFMCPLFVVIEEVDDEHSVERERYWYDTLKAAGAELTNHQYPATVRRGNWDKEGWIKIRGAYYKIIKQITSEQGEERLIVEALTGKRSAFIKCWFYKRDKLREDERRESPQRSE